MELRNKKRRTLTETLTSRQRMRRKRRAKIRRTRLRIGVVGAERGKEMRPKKGMRRARE